MSGRRREVGRLESELLVKQLNKSESGGCCVGLTRNKVEMQMIVIEITTGQTEKKNGDFLKNEG